MVKVGNAGLFTTGTSGTENSILVGGNTMVGASTYGWTHPRYPEGAVPVRSVFENTLCPGMERWDMTDRGLRKIWDRNDAYLRLLFAIAPLIAHRTSL